MDKKVSFPKKIDYPAVYKDVSGFRKRQRFEKTKTQQSAEVIIIPYDYIISLSTQSYNHLLIEADIYAKQLQQQGKSPLILPSFMINYIRNVESISMAKDNIADLYQHFYRHCALLGIFFTIAREDFHTPELIEVLHQSMLRDKNAGYVYHDYAVNYRNIQDQTILHNHSIITKKVSGNIFIIKFFVENRNLVLPLAISAIELLFGVVALLVHPKDKRYKGIIGRNALIPITNKAIPIIADERIDREDKWGVGGLIPGHIPKDMEQAKQYDLPLDVFAFDYTGYFTNAAGQFAHKEMEVFRENLPRFIDDIGNLEATIPAEVLIYYNKTNNQQVYPIASQQWFFSIPSTLAYPDMEIAIFPSTHQQTSDHFYQQKKRCISKYTKAMIKFAFWQKISNKEQSKQTELSKTYISHSVSTFLTLVTKSAAKNSAGVKLYLFLSFIHGIIEEEFSIYERIESLMHIPSTSKVSLLDQYDARLQTQTDDKEILKSISLMKTYLTAAYHSDDELAIQKLLNHLDAAHILTANKEGGCIIQRSKLFDTSDTLVHDRHSLDTAYASTLLIEHHISKISEPNIAVFVNTQTEYLSLLLFQQLSLQPTLGGKRSTIFSSSNNISDHKDINPIDERYSQYGSDVIRSWAISFPLPNISKDKNSSTSTEFLEQEYHFLQKVRNVGRMIMKNTKNEASPRLKNKEYAIFAEQELNEVSDIDIWIIKKISLLITHYTKLSHKFASPTQYLELHDTIHFDLCDTYVTYCKQHSNKKRDQILSKLYALALQLLHAFLPLCTQQLRYMMYDNTIIPFPQMIQLPPDIKKNHQLSLVMDIFGTGKKRYLTTHSYGQLFTLSIKGNKSFLDASKEHEYLFFLLCRDANIEYYNENQELSETLSMTKKIANITLGGECKKKETTELSSAMIEAEIQSKHELMQRVRNILMLLHPSETALKEEYHHQILLIKKEITDLDYLLKKVKYLGN